jgi:hypothetical protein
MCRLSKRIGRGWSVGRRGSEGHLCKREALVAFPELHGRDVRKRSYADSHNPVSSSLNLFEVCREQKIFEQRDPNTAKHYSSKSSFQV